MGQGLTRNDEFRCSAWSPSVDVDTALSLDCLLTPGWYGLLGAMISEPDPTVALRSVSTYFAQILHADELMLFWLPENQRPKVVMQSDDRVERARTLDRYCSDFFVLDPIYVDRKNLSLSGALRLSDMVISEDFYRSDYYRLHYHLTGLVDEICFCVSDGNNGHFLLSLARGESVGRFVSEELDVAKLAAPVLCGALQRGSLALLSVPNNPSHASKFHQMRNNFGREVVTSREFDILSMMLKGYSLQLIANRLNIAYGTAKVHRKAIYRKLDINSHVELLSLFIDVVDNVELDLCSDPLERYFKM